MIPTPLDKVIVMLAIWVFQIVNKNFPKLDNTYISD